MDADVIHCRVNITAATYYHVSYKNLMYIACKKLNVVFLNYGFQMQ